MQNLPERVAVLEEKYANIERRLDRLETQLDNLRTLMIQLFIGSWVTQTALILGLYFVAFK
jgi:hypothetical protein